MQLRKIHNWKDWDFLGLDRVESARYLCKQKTDLFVSSVSLLKDPDRTMPANCSMGCLYVQGKKMVIPVDKLDEIYYIIESE